MKKILLLLVLLPVLVNAQVNLSGSSFSANNGICSGSVISVNGNYLLDIKFGDRYQYSQTLSLQAPNYQMCFNSILYSVPSNKFSMRWSGSQWQLGFVGTAAGQSPSFVVISSIPFGSVYGEFALPSCDAPIFGGIVRGLPTITGSTCVGSTLTASAYGATAFQWYKDLNVIPGATNATYTPTETGDYSVATTMEEGYWTATSNSPANQQLIDVFFINSRIGWVLEDGGQIFKTTFAGDLWTQQTSGVTTNLNAIHFTDLNNGVAVGASGVIIRTINGGTSWQSVSSGVTNNLTDVFFLNANIGWAVGSQYVVLKTTNGGATWSRISIDNAASTNDSYNDIQFTDSNTGYVAGNSATNSTSFVRKSVDGGVNWTVSKLESAGVIRRLSFIDNNTGWIGGQSSNPAVTLPQVSKTANAGTNWLSYSALQTVNYANRGISSLQFIDANRGWMLSSAIGSESQIITTRDGGNTFFMGSRYSTQETQYVGYRIFMLPSGSDGWIIGRDFASNGNILRYSNSICTSNTISIQSSITIANTTPASWCKNTNFSIPFTTTGTYTNGNVFTAQLSNAAGSFASPTLLGTVTGTSSGTITATIPNTVAVGTGYKIRIISSLPAVCNSLEKTIEVTTSCQCLLNTSLMTGNWGTAATWSCGHVPLVTEPVQIAPTHTVTVNVNGTAKSLDLKGILRKQTGFSLLIKGN